MKIKEEVLVEDKYAWDGFNILKNGHAMFAQDIVKELNCLEKKIDLTQKKIIDKLLEFVDLNQLEENSKDREGGAENE